MASQQVALDGETVNNVPARQWSKSYHVTSNTTNTVTSATAYIQSILISVSGAGSAWTIKVQDKSGTPLQVYPATTAVAGVVQLNFTGPVLANGGIDIITAGTTPGTADIFVTYWQ